MRWIFRRRRRCWWRGRRDRWLRRGVVVVGTAHYCAVILRLQRELHSQNVVHFYFEGVNAHCVLRENRGEDVMIGTAMVCRPEQGFVQVTAATIRPCDLLAGHQLKLGAHARSVVLTHFPRHAPGNVGDALAMQFGVRAHAITSARVHVAAHLPLQICAGFLRKLKRGRRRRNWWPRRPSLVSAAPCRVPQFRVLTARVSRRAVAECKRLSDFPTRLGRPNQVIVQIAAGVTCHDHLQGRTEPRPASLAAGCGLLPVDLLDARVEQHGSTANAWHIASATRNRGVVAHAPHWVFGDELIACFG